MDETATATGRLLSLDLGAWRASIPVPTPAPMPREEPVWCVPGVPAAPVAPCPSLELRALRAAVDALAGAPVSGRAVDLAELLRLGERLRGLGLRALGEFAATGGCHDDGAATAASWLQHAQVIGDDSARAAVRLAARLREDLTELGQALVDGQTTVEHVRAAAAGTAGLDPAVVRDAQGALLGLLRAAEPAMVRRQLRERAEAIDPALGRDAARRQRARRGFFADALAGAGVLLGGTLDDEDGAVLLHGLDLAVEASRAAGDTRGLPARRADALVQWARRAAHEIAGPGDSLGQDAHTIRTHLLITCTPDQLQAMAAQRAHDQLHDEPGGQLDALALLRGQRPTTPPLLPTGAPLLPAALRRLACDATLSLLAQQQPTDTNHTATTGTGTAGRFEPLYVGRSARTVTGLQFKALVVRDRHCVIKGCRARPAQCEAHHVQHWLDGGATDPDNLVLLCHRHHHDHHDRGHNLQHHDGRWLTQHGWGTDP